MTRLMEVVRQRRAQVAARLRPAGRRLRTLTTRIAMQVARGGAVLVAQGRRLGRSLVTPLHRGLPVVRQVMTQTTRRLWQMLQSCGALALWVGRRLVSIGGAGLVVSSISLAVTLLPTRFSVTPGVPLDPADILSTPFVVQNTGYLPVHITHFICFFPSITLRSGTYGTGTGHDAILHGFPQQVRQWTLTSTQPITIRCPQTLWSLRPDFAPDPVTFAELALTLYYRPIWLPFGRDRIQTFDFTTATDSQGHLRWLP